MEEILGGGGSQVSRSGVGTGWSQTLTNTVGPRAFLPP